MPTDPTCGTIPWTRIDVKPISANRMFVPGYRNVGRKKVYRARNSPEYTSFRKTVLAALPDEIELFDRMTLELKVTFATKASDLDNSLKGFIDTLQAKYAFNDNLIYHIQATKHVNRNNLGYEFRLLPCEE